MKESKTKGGQLSLFDFIVKYWVEFAFGVLVAGGGWFIKRYFTLENLRRQKEQDEFYNKIKTEIDKEHECSKEDDVALKTEMNALTTVLTSLKRGLLSVQGRQFKADCKRLLAESHVITFDEYQQITEDHQAYHDLGGNHNGDALFELVRKKAEKELNVQDVE